MHAEVMLTTAEMQYGKEGVVLIIEKLEPGWARPWTRTLNKFRVAEATLGVSPRLMAWLDPEELRLMRQEWR